MLAIISAPGSRGDVNPMIAIGHQLRQRGMEVVVSIAETYSDVARAADLQVEPVIDQAAFERILSNPDMWKPIRGARAVFREIGAQFLQLHDEVIRKHHRPGETVLVAHPLDFASRVYRDHDTSTPLVSIHLAPAILRTFPFPPRLSPWWFEPTKPGWAVRAGYWAADLLGVDPMLRGPVNELRSNYQLPPIRRVMNRWWLSPDRILAMYPDWFAPATKQFCPLLMHAGFPLNDGDDTEFDAPDDRPIVFTAGTAHHHCRRFFELAANACQSLRQPGLLLSTHQQNFPGKLPPSVTTATYLPLKRLLPQCRAIVHHGGIGTTSQALAAGIPQVIRPMAFDQFDNACRVEQLGCGVWLHRDRDLASSLASVLGNPTISDHCRAIASRMSGVAGAKIAADEIERVLTRSDSFKAADTSK